MVTKDSINVYNLINVLNVNIIELLKNYEKI